MDNICTYKWNVERKWFHFLSKTITAHQGELTLGAEENLIKIMYKYDLSDINDVKKKISTGQLISKLTAAGDLPKLFRAMLSPTIKLDYIRQMPMTVQGAVLRDFFVLNPGLTLLLQSFLEGTVLTRIVTQEAEKDKT